jgi:hypothetical protein
VSSIFLMRVVSTISDNIIIYASYLAISSSCYEAGTIPCIIRIHSCYSASVSIWHSVGDLCTYGSIDDRRSRIDEHQNQQLSADITSACPSLTTPLSLCSDLEARYEVQV